MMKPVLMLCLAALCSSPIVVRPAAFAQDADEEIAPAHTVESLRAKVRLYTAKAATYRKEAERHKEVARRFREERDGKGRPLNSRKDIEEMDKECQQLSQHALALAKDAELLAQFYETHAKTLELASAQEKRAQKSKSTAAK